MKDIPKDKYFNKDEVVILQKEKKRGSSFDFILPAAVFLLSGFGLLIIYSATKFSMPNNVTDPAFYLKKQGFWLIGAIVVFILMQFINYRALSRFWWVLLIAAVAMLVAVLLFGYEVNGSKSWLNLGISSVQPSEFAKILMVVITSALLSKWPREKVNTVGFKKVAFSLLAALIIIVLVLLQPDYGTALIFFIVYLGILFI
jgi:cell division protein FtsW (lipid II flippase)